MAQASVVRGTKLLIKLGDAGDPETFTHMCSINGSRALQLTAQTNDIAVPDCADPDLMAWIEREKVSLSGSINGQGVFNAPDFDSFWDFFEDSDERNVQVVVDVTGAEGGRTISGAWHCTQLEFSGNRGEKILANIQMLSTGILVKSTNP